MAAWREVCTAFGAKPSRIRDSAEALAKRALSEAGPPRIHLLVDLYHVAEIETAAAELDELLEKFSPGARTTVPPPAS